MLPTHPDKRSLTAEFNKLHAYGFSTKDEIIDMARLMQSRGYDPKDYEKIIEPIINQKFKVVYGSRVLGKNRYSLKNFSSIYRIFFNHMLTLFSNIFL